MKPDIDKLKETLSTFDMERRKLSDLIYELEETPKIKATVGKYFKYYNSYNAKENWWMYIHVKDYKEEHLVTDIFQEDTRSKIEFNVEHVDYGRSYLHPNYIEITKREYDVALRKLLRKLNKKLKIR